MTYPTSGTTVQRRWTGWWRRERHEADGCAGPGQRYRSRGRNASADGVLAVLGGPGMGPQAIAHAKGALNKLHAWRLAQLGRPGAEVVTADLGVPVRVGPAVALWSGPWVSELMTLVGHLGEHRRPK